MNENLIFSKEILASKFLSFVLLDRHVFFFLLYQVEEKRERTKIEEIVDGLLPCRSLIGVTR